MAYAGTTAATTAQNIPLRMTAFGIHGGFTTALTTSISPTTNGYGPPNKQSAGWWQYHTTDASSVLISSMCERSRVRLSSSHRLAAQ